MSLDGNVYCLNYNDHCIYTVVVCSLVRILASHWLYSCKGRQPLRLGIAHCALQIGGTRVRGGDHSGEDGSSTSFPSDTTVPLQMQYCSISVLLLLQYFSISVLLLWHYAEVHYQLSLHRIAVSDPMYIVIQQILLIITGYCSWSSPSTLANHSALAL